MTEAPAVSPSELRRTARRGLAIYVAVVIVLSGSLEAHIPQMWTPAVASVIARLVLREGFSDRRGCLRRGVADGPGRVPGRRWHAAARLVERSELGGLAPSADLRRRLCCRLEPRALRRGVRRGGRVDLVGVLPDSLETGSVWPVVYAHATWNAIIQGPFDGASKGPDAALWIGESGILVVIVLAGVAVVVSRGAWTYIRRLPGAGVPLAQVLSTSPAPPTPR